MSQSIDDNLYSLFKFPRPTQRLLFSNSWRSCIIYRPTDVIILLCVSVVGGFKLYTQSVSQVSKSGTSAV